MQADTVTLYAAAQSGFPSFEQLSLKAPKLLTPVSIGASRPLSRQILPFNIQGKDFLIIHLPVEKLKNLSIEFFQLQRDFPDGERVIMKRGDSDKALCFRKLKQVAVDVSSIQTPLPGQVYTLWIDTRGKELTASLKTVSQAQEQYVGSWLTIALIPKMIEVFPFGIMAESTVRVWSEELPQPKKLLILSYLQGQNLNWQNAILRLISLNQFKSLIKAHIKTSLPMAETSYIECITQNFLLSLKGSNSPFVCEGVYSLSELEKNFY